MSRLRVERAEELPQTILQEESSALTNTNQLDNTSETHPTVNDHLANLRRRAPTRHSIKSLTSRKSPKQGSIKEHRTCLDPTVRQQYSYSQSSALSDGSKLFCSNP
ncbi:unnamed protein product [Rotaria socialis]|uniref:Uncharacterized protein n=1 Tax=Rotaria socialis TaxID=392032 RepID=A0A818JU43_9BILA|nr:unnamed protein product [Rotaria socialis]CAF3545684.1 unnamed protein product [Rotaria socialis]